MPLSHLDSYPTKLCASHPAESCSNRSPRSSNSSGSSSTCSNNINDKLSQLELLVVCDAFLNETAEHAHVVLPIADTDWETAKNFSGQVAARMAADSPSAARVSGST